MLQILGVILFIYLLGVSIGFIVAIQLEFNDSRWQFAKTQYIFLYPIIPFIYLYQYLNKYNNYLNKNNLKQMDLKILGKAMGFMFFPTLGVLLMLLVGFFDPIAMWAWIKSDSGWAVFTRIIIFLIETGLVTALYFDYLEKDKIEKINNDNKVIDKQKEIRYDQDIRYLFSDTNYEHNYYFHQTENPQIVLVKQVKK